jgi:hypothetical protein
MMNRISILYAVHDILCYSLHGVESVSKISKSRNNVAIDVSSGLNTRGINSLLFV